MNLEGENGERRNVGDDQEWLPMRLPLAAKTQRAQVLEAAYTRNPERFVRKPPIPPELPTAAWINKPDTKEAAAQ